MWALFLKDRILSLFPQDYRRTYCKLSAARKTEGSISLSKAFEAQYDCSYEGEMAFLLCPWAAKSDWKYSRRTVDSDFYREPLDPLLPWKNRLIHLETCQRSDAIVCVWTIYNESVQGGKQPVEFESQQASSLIFNHGQQRRSSQGFIASLLSFFELYEPIAKV